MRLYWVRHGQMALPSLGSLDEATADRLINSRDEGPLTARGIGEARRVADHLRTHELSALYSSPLVRARQTAAATAAETGLEVTTVPELVEIRTGHLPPGATSPALVRAAKLLPVDDEAKVRIAGGLLIPLYFARWLRGETVDGESPTQIRERLDVAIRLLQERHAPNDAVALFAHGFLIYFLANYVADPAHRIRHTIRRPYVRNGSITRLDLDPGGRLHLVSYANARHLRPARGRR